MSPGPDQGVRLAELVAALSLGIDLGFGQPMEHVLRQCLIALRIAEQMGLDDHDRSTVYYTALLVNVGCHTDAHEQAKWYGDDILLKSGKYDHEPKSLRETAAMLRNVGSGQRPGARVRTGLTMLANVRQAMAMIAMHASMAQQFARNLDLPDDVCEAVGASYEWWNGKGWPGALAGDAIPAAARIAAAAEYLEVAHRTDGAAVAVDLAKRRSGKMFDPAVSDCVVAQQAAIFGGLEGTSTWNAVVESEPALTMRLDDAQFDMALHAIADFVDLKSPYFLGHSAAVSRLAEAAGRAANLDDGDVTILRRAGLVHGFGRLGVSNAILDKPGPLAVGEWERIRMHPYLTERMLHQSPHLAVLGRLAVCLRERLDGSGYPRGLPASGIPFAARILGAADAYQAMLEPRPHRGALAESAAIDALRAEVRSGRMDGAAVDAVLAGAGHAAPRRRQGPVGLTPREMEVLSLVAQGLSNREIGERLVISTKTAGNHVEHVYTKIGAGNRAAASLFAVQHGLIGDDPKMG